MLFELIKAKVQYDPLTFYIDRDNFVNVYSFSGDINANQLWTNIQR